MREIIKLNRKYIVKTFFIGAYNIKMNSKFAQEIDLDFETDDLRDKYGKPNLARIKERYDKVSRGKDGIPLYFTKDNITQTFGDGSVEERRISVAEMMELLYNKDQVSVSSIKI